VRSETTTELNWRTVPKHRTHNYRFNHILIILHLIGAHSIIRSCLLINIVKMTTRRMLLEQNLGKAQDELKDQRALCDKLLSERDDNEAEIKSMVARNTALKRQLNELSDQLTEAEYQRNSLQQVVDSLHECLTVHEAALEKISFLQQQLVEARDEIAVLNLRKVTDWSQTISLSEELSAVLGHFEDKNSSYFFKGIEMLIHRCHKCINKKRNRIKSQMKKRIRLCRKHVSLKKDSLKLKAVTLSQRLQLEMLATKLNSAYKEIEELSTATLELTQLSQQNRELTEWFLENQLEMEAKAGKHLNSTEIHKVERVTETTVMSGFSTGSPEHVVASAKLSRVSGTGAARRRRRKQARRARITQGTLLRQQGVEIGSTSTLATPPPAEAFEPSMSPSILTDVQHSPEPPCTQQPSDGSFSSRENSTQMPSRTSAEVASQPPSVTLRNTLVFSDQIGIGLGPMMNVCLQQKTLNMCYPGLPFDRLIEKIQIKSSEYDELTTIVIMAGNHTKATKKSLDICIQCLLDIQQSTKCKIILCSFPFCSNMTSKQNQFIYRLNLFMHNATYQYHDNFLLFEINKFIKNFALTEDSMYLSKKLKRCVADLVAHNVFDSGVTDIKHSLNDNDITRNNNFLN
jgi:hypothetical protein